MIKSSEVKYRFDNATGNLGDLLCSPKHYFELVPCSEICVVGGGVKTQIIRASQNVRAFNTMEPIVLWGAGISGTASNVTRIDNLGLTAWGIRDRRMVANDKHFLPCVSCMHPMIDLARNSKVSGKGLIYLNADPQVVSLKSLINIHRIAKKEKLDFATNRIFERGFLDKWLQVSVVITNSYHGAYWSLLAGKSVVLIGYSSKFVSLFDNFELDNSIFQVKKGDQRSLLKAVQEAIRAPSVSLPGADRILEEYRSLQRRFAEELIAKGLIYSWKEKEKSEPYVLCEPQTPEWLRIGREYAVSVAKNAKRVPRALLNKARLWGQS